jgi:hypothetical protein
MNNWGLREQKKKNFIAQKKVFGVGKKMNPQNSPGRHKDISLKMFVV